MPLVSVVIPTYNRADVVCRAVDSVLAQELQDIEIIVVDDGSSDDTLSVLNKYGGAIRVLSQYHKGVSAARNLGILYGRAALVAFLDSDDEWLPQKLRRQVRLFRRAKTEFICHTDEIWMRGSREIPQKNIHRKQGGRFFERALQRCLISPSSVILSRNLLKKVGLFDETLPAAEDYDLWLRITAFYEVEFIPERLVIKNGGRSDQLSVTTKAIDRFRIAAIQKIIRDPRLQTEYRTAAFKELRRKCAIVSSGLSKKGMIDEALTYERLALAGEELNSGSPGL